MKPGETGVGRELPDGQKNEGFMHGSGRRPQGHVNPAGQLGVALNVISRTRRLADSEKKILPNESTARPRGDASIAEAGFPLSPLKDLVPLPAIVETFPLVTEIIRIRLPFDSAT